MPSDFFERVRFRGQPVANPDSVVVGDHTRFTVLTSCLVRLEWSETGTFEDRGTFAFPSRYAPAPPFELKRADQSLTIDTGTLTLCYRGAGESFAPGNLSIAYTLNKQQRTWKPGLPNPGNLRGTRRTLDRCAGDAALEEGLLSRAGWSLFDDSQSVRFNPEDGWVEPGPQHPVQDWYFFGYGHDYRTALADYIRFGGRVPLVPRYVLGAWWSRYWAYSDQDLRELIADFEAHDLPLDVLVVDMDWHTPDSWTGYTWNRELFPDPPAFLRWAHGKGLRVALNLHPAQGVQAFEEVYPQFAQAMGVDPESRDAIPFRISDKKFARHYFELLHHPLEEEGVDFWWVDWQQGERSEMKGLDPLPWLNHLHFCDSRRRGQRPMLYSRWGGLGNHRYPTGFSGDTYVGWPALQFQPYFTATAANVAYGWWGHDIGGHMGGPTEPELYARWVQFGALSPSLRLHATKDPLAERRPWTFPPDAYRAAKAAFHLRYQLVPYLYTMARVAHDTGVSLCRPMYYESPDTDAAYVARYQYYLGDQMIVAPIVQLAGARTGLATADVWIPDGTWIDFQTKETFEGPGWVRLCGDLDRVLLLVRAGGILPLSAPFSARSRNHMASGTTDSMPRDQILLCVFPGPQGSFQLYEDDGLSEDYREGVCEWTPIFTSMTTPETWTVDIGPVEGHCPNLPRQRGHQVRLEGSYRPDRVLIDGEETAEWTYDAEGLATIIPIPHRAKTESIRITAMAAGGISALDPSHNRQQRLSDAGHLLGWHDYGGEDPDLLAMLLHKDLPGRLDAIARLGGPFAHFIEYSTPEEAAQQLGRLVVAGPTARSEPYDLDVTWTLDRGGKSEEHRAEIRQATGSHILRAPFGFDGQVRSMRWNAEARITWRGATLSYKYESQVLFPTIPVWHSLAYDRTAQSLAWEQIWEQDGELPAGVGWTSHRQSADELMSVHDPHAVILSEAYLPELKQQIALSAYLRTTIISPVERNVVLLFRAAGPVELYLNGEKIEEESAEQQQAWLHPLLRNARRTETMRLRPGNNMLLVHTQPPDRERPWWYFGGSVTTPQGKPLIDLEFA
ncbi:MAG: glycoside hydrolase family 31 protein [Anaerolineae bacterium]|jgi:alpha-glucosidase